MIPAVGGFVPATIPLVYTLTGTSGSPNNVINIETSPTDSTASITIGGTGALTGALWPTSVVVPREWASRSVDGDNYWCRVTQDATSGGGTRTGPGGWTSGTILQITSSGRTWSLLNTSDLLSSPSWTLKIEIADDSGMSNILATGYYKLIASVDV